MRPAHRPQRAPTHAPGTQPEGALFCDGQYVDAGQNLECTGEADGAVSCAVDPTRPSAWSLGWFGALATAGLVVGRRRKA